VTGVTGLDSRFAVAFAKQDPHREIHGLARVSEVVPTDEFLDQIVVDLDLDPLPRAATIPATYNPNRAL